MIEEIKVNERILGIIIYSKYQKDGIAFFTPDCFSQQLGYMNRPAGYIIPPHVHNLVERKVELTQEVLIIKSGKVRVDFYDDERNYLESRIVTVGDVVLLAHGGHGFEMLQQSEIIEVKQGPYCGEQDKIRFNPIDSASARIITHG
jgi:mannose-6-phosphate isomerase-like protein (cupin superfamily)